MNPPLRARLLGPVDLRRGEQQLPPLESARAEPLLAYLLLHRDAPQPRQHLAFLLWPGSTEAQAQTNLRKVLHILRRALPDADRLIEVGPRTLQWRADAPLWLDVEQFERALAADRLEDAAGRARSAARGEPPAADAALPGIRGPRPRRPRLPRLRHDAGARAGERAGT